MSVRKFASLATITALFAAATGAVHAAPAPSTSTTPMDFTLTADTSPLPLGTETMKWDAEKGHWGVMLNLQQPQARAASANDIQAGAYYKITPSLRVGGSMSFGSEQISPGVKPNVTDPGQPRVQLETKFRF